MSIFGDNKRILDGKHCQWSHGVPSYVGHICVNNCQAEVSQRIGNNCRFGIFKFKARIIYKLNSFWSLWQGKHGNIAWGHKGTYAKTLDNIEEA